MNRLLRILIVYSYPLLSRKEFNNYNSSNANTFKYTPRENMLILFPSNIEHAVERNKSKHDRISIAFNITIK